MAACSGIRSFINSCFIRGCNPNTLTKKTGFIMGRLFEKTVKTTVDLSITTYGATKNATVHFYSNYASPGLKKTQAFAKNQFSNLAKHKKMQNLLNTINKYQSNAKKRLAPIQRFYELIAKRATTFFNLTLSPALRKSFNWTKATSFQFYKTNKQPTINFAKKSFKFIKEDMLTPATLKVTQVGSAILIKIRDSKLGQTVSNKIISPMHNKVAKPAYEKAVKPFMNQILMPAAKKTFNTMQDLHCSFLAGYLTSENQRSKA